MLPSFFTIDIVGTEKYSISYIYYIRKLKIISKLVLILRAMFTTLNP